MNFRRLKLMRAAARVKRNHIMHTNHSQTVGEHTFGVIALIHDVIIPRKPSPQLIRAALYHDAHEAVRGDPPAPALWRKPELKNQYGELDAAIENEFEFVVPDLETWEAEVLSFCDSMEFVIYALEEVGSGNSIFMPRARKTISKIRERGSFMCTPAAEALLNIMAVRASEYPDHHGEEETYAWPG